MPILGICLSGRYRDPGNTRWLKPSYEIIPYGAGSFETALDMADAMHREFTRLVLERYGLGVYRKHSLDKQLRLVLDGGRPSRTTAKSWT